MTKKEKEEEIKEEAIKEEKGKPERAKPKVADWGRDGFFEAVATVRLTSEMLGTRPSETQDDLCQFLRNDKGEVAIPEGYFRGVLRDSAPYIGVPKTVCDHLGVSDVKIDCKKPSGTLMYTGTPGMRGVVSLYEKIPAGTVIEASFLMPKVTHNAKKFKKHLDMAGKFCGLGALRKQGYGRFSVVKIMANGQ